MQAPRNSEVQGEEGVEADTEPEAGEDIAQIPADMADPHEVVGRVIPSDIFERYDVYSYRNAAVILSETRQDQLGDILAALRQFSITTDMIRRAGGNESEVPKMFSNLLRPAGWHETTVRGDLLVKLYWREQIGERRGRPQFNARTKEITRERFLDGHKIDYVKDRVAFDLEWNSKDQTFDRDLYAFRAFFECGVIDAGVLVTRSADLNPVFRQLGEALKRDGSVEYKSNGQPRMVYEKYGASTTWMGKLLYHLNAGRNGGCPVLAFGIRAACIADWRGNDAQ